MLLASGDLGAHGLLRWKEQPCFCTPGGRGGSMLRSQRLRPSLHL